MPARAPASMDMLQTVKRSSMLMARMAEPAYSMTCPAAPLEPSLAMMAKITSLALTCAPRTPSTRTRRVLERRCQVAWVASTWVISLAPAPKAKAPKAPWVEVWESPHTNTMPGWVRPCSGPTTCTMPWRGSPKGKCKMPWAWVFSTKRSTTLRCSGSVMAAITWLRVEMPWSGVATT